MPANLANAAPRRSHIFASRRLRTPSNTLLPCLAPQDLIEEGFAERERETADKAQLADVMRRKKSALEAMLSRAEASYRDYESLLEFYHRNNELATSHHNKVLMAKVMVRWYEYTSERLSEEHAFEVDFLVVQRGLSIYEATHSPHLAVRCVFDAWKWALGRLDDSEISDEQSHLEATPKEPARKKRRRTTRKPRRDRLLPSIAAPPHAKRDAPRQAT